MQIHQFEVICFTMKMILASHGINTVDFILWGSWMSVKDFTGIHSIVRRNKEKLQKQILNLHLQIWFMKCPLEININIQHSLPSHVQISAVENACTLRTRLHGADHFASFQITFAQVAVTTQHKKHTSASLSCSLSCWASDQTMK